MQDQFALVTFEYQNRVHIRTVKVNGEPWFYAMDVCKALEIKNGRDAVSRLDQDDVGITDAIDSMGRTVKMTIINEAALYELTFKSRTDGAKRFKRWVTSEVIPQIRKTGAFGMRATPVFVRRFNDNWDRVKPGYFSVISELYIRLFGRFEQYGYQLADTAPDGKEIRPDISVGKHFAKFLREVHPEHFKKAEKYKHLIGGIEVDANQYPNELLPLYIQFVDTDWMRNCAEDYLRGRDPKALELLPKLLPPPDPENQKTAIAGSKFEQIKTMLSKIDPKK